MARKDPLIPGMDRVVESAFADAQATVRQLRAEHPGASPEDLVNRVVRQTAKEMAIGGAMTGGAAASPVAGITMAAAAVGTDAAFNANRLGEMVMAIGLIYGHGDATVEERKLWLVAVMGMADSAAVGLSGLAARWGARGSSRLLAKVPSSSKKAFVAKAARSGSPWGLAALLPYGVGAGVGAAGNAALVLAVGRAAREYFTRTPPRDGRVAEYVDEDTVLLDDEPAPAPPPGPAGDDPDDDIVDAEIVG